MQKAHFDIHASIVFQLGEHLISDAVQAVVELVKNSFDADATYCSLRVDTSAKAGKESQSYKTAEGFIIIEDNGVGMTPNQIEDGFLVISNSMKREMKRKKETTKKGRTPLGDKGLGRLSAQRLADNVEIYTVPENSKLEYYVGFSWKDFENQSKLSQVAVATDNWETNRKCGTRLVLSGLKEPESWSGAARDDLTRDLSSMISPYKSVSEFRLVATIDGINLELQEFAEKLRNAAQLNYQIAFEDSVLRCYGNARMDYISADKKEDKKAFQKLVENDDGKEFFAFLNSQRSAERFNFKLSKKAGWYIEYSAEFDLDDFDKAKLIKGKFADPGPFKGEVDYFDLGQTAAKASVFDSASEYKSAIKNSSGIKVYRDGFGIRVDKDWLGLGKALTGGGSFYTLRPDNTIGYIAISAKHNSQLEETTDREGFRVTPHYENFCLILNRFVKFTEESQTFIKRNWQKYWQKHNFGDEQDATPKTIKQRTHQRLDKAEMLSSSLKTARAAITKASASSSRSSMRKGLQEAEKVLALNSESQDFVSMKSDFDLLALQVETLQEQMSQMYEAVGVGLTAEALSHEMRNVSDQLAARNSKASKHMRDKEIRDALLLAHLEFINTSVNALRKQLSHLSPSLKYVREKREEMTVSSFCEELGSFYKERFDKVGITLRIKINKDFSVRMNRGKLNQVLDNLLLNSDYWLREDLRLGKLKKGFIDIEISKPHIRISDNGRGFAKSIEPNLFEPFVTTKAKGVGRGLGLFIVKQLLDAEGCNIDLLPDRNKSGNRFIVQVSLNGALSGN